MPNIKDIDYNKLMSLRRMTDADIRAAHARVLIAFEGCPRILDEALASGRWRNIITIEVIETLSAEDTASRPANVIPITKGQTSRK